MRPHMACIRPSASRNARANAISIISLHEAVVTDTIDAIANGQKSSV